MTTQLQYEEVDLFVPIEGSTSSRRLTRAPQPKVVYPNCLENHLTGLPSVFCRVGNAGDISFEMYYHRDALGKNHELVIEDSFGLGSPKIPLDATTAAKNWKTSIEIRRNPAQLENQNYRCVGAMPVEKAICKPQVSLWIPSGVEEDTKVLQQRIVVVADPEFWNAAQVRVGKNNVTDRVIKEWAEITMFPK